MKLLLKIIAFVTCIVSVQGCIEDAFTDSPSDQPVFSTDTLHLGTVFTDEPTPTSRMLVYNRHNKSLSINDISLSGPNADCFRLNVDGVSGKSFSDVEIRAKDSIFVFVEATLPEAANAFSADYEASLDFTTNGVRQSVVLAAHGQNVERLKGLTLEADTRFTADKPYQIFDSLVVAPGATLTIAPGSRLCFHDKSMLVVRGTLLSEGTADSPVVLGGDRTGNVVSDISFEIMSRQWTGVFFTSTSKGNRLSHTLIQNTTQGVAINGDPEADYTATPQLHLLNSRLRNSGGLGFEAYHSAVTAIGCEFAEAADGLVRLQGGTHTFNHCTFANYYLFAVLGGPAIQFSHLSSDPDTGLDDGTELPYVRADFANCIIYGLGSELSHGDLTGTGIFFRRCLLKSAGSDDENFLFCLWDCDPLYYTVREEYIFDYRLKPDSPAIGAADPTLTLPDAATDAYGLSRGAVPDLGAYVFTPPTDTE